MKAPLPDNESQRLAALYSYDILDTPSEPTFDDLTHLAAQICETPVALITFVDKTRLWFKSQVGLTMPEISRDESFCAFTILQSELFVVPNVPADPRFQRSRLVADHAQACFYAGAPLINPEGLRVGCLAVIDYQPRNLTTSQQDALTTLSRHVMTQLELRRSVSTLAQTIAQKQKTEEGLLKTQAQLKLLNNISTGITSGMSVAQVIERALRHISRYFPALRVAYATIDEQGMMRFTHAIEPAGMTPITDVMVHLTIARDYWRSLRSGQPVAVAEITDDPRLQPLTNLMLVGGTQATLDIPVLYTNKLLGVLSLNSPNARVWNEYEISTLTEVAQYLAIAIQDAYTQQERRQAELALQDSERRYRSVVDSVKEVIFQTNALGKWTFLNPAWTEITGFEVHESLGQPCLNYVHPSDRQLSFYRFQPFLVKETATNYCRYEVRYLTKTGGYRWIEVYAQLTFDIKGHMTGTSGTLHDITERRQAEEALLRISKAVESSSEAIAIADVTGQSIYFNPAFIKLFTYTVLELNAVGGPAVLYEDFAVYQEVFNTTRQGLSWSGELVMRNRRGQEIPISLRANAIKDHNGQIIGFVGLYTDISDRKRSEEVLKANEALLRTFVEHTPAAVAMFDRDMRYLVVSHRWLKDYRLGDRNLIGVQHYDVFPELSDDWRAMYDRCLAGAVERCEEAHFPRRDGSFDWVRWEIHPWYTSNQDIGGIIMFTEVITERKRAEEELQRQNQRAQLFADMTLRIRQSLQLDEILDTTVAAVREFLQTDRVLVYQFQPDWSGVVVVESVDEQWRPSLGAEILDTCFQEGHWQAYQQGRIRAIADIQAANLTACHQTLLTQFQVRANLVVPILESNQLWGLMIAHQCSAPRQWQPFEIDFLQQLANQVGIALSQARLLVQETQQREQLAQQNLALEAARREAEQASQMKSTFLATMSHEIRTPMNAVLGMASLLIDTPLNDDQRDFVETIRAGSENLLTLINDILDFSKLESGEVELEILDFDLTLCIEEVVDLLAATAHRKGLEIATLVHSDVPTHLRGDPSRLRQILINLVGNAIKFTEVGEVILSAQLQSIQDQSATICFAITDTGIGIAPEGLPRLFQPFSQVDASMTRKYGGTGLGLAICQQLVELMGGTLGVESDVGQGSRFWFTLTFETQPPPITESAMLADLMACLQGLKLLVVDDNAAHRQILRYYATHWGIQVSEAEGAIAALDTLHQAADQEDPYHLVLLDGQMPDMDGITLAAQIKQDPTLSTTPLILMTTLNQGGLSRPVREQFAAYVVKPIKQVRLQESLLSVLGIALPATLQPNLRSPALDDPLTSFHLAVPDLPATLAEPESFPKRAKVKILLVEDNAVNQKVLLKQLHRFGYDADIAANGQEALDMLEAIPYQMVLMDCQMPVLDGYAATRIIREREQLTQTRTVIIAMTANAMKGDRAKCLEVGMDDYMSKPIRQEELASKIAYWANILNDADKAQSPPAILDPDLAPRETADPTTLINWDYLNTISEGDDEFALELLLLFVNDSRALLEVAQTSLESAIASNPTPLGENEAILAPIQHTAHQIKGSSGNLGLQAIQVLAETLENQIRTCQLREAQASLTGLLDLTDQIYALILSRTTPSSVVNY